MAAKPSLVTLSNNLSVIGRNLEPPGEKEYLIAFGPDGRFLFGTQDGYAAGHLPGEMVRAIQSGAVMKIARVSFGSESDCWFFAYQSANGSYKTWYGSMIPTGLRQFLFSNSSSSVRVEFGANNSYVAWTPKTWICHNVPGTLEAYLKDTSSNYQYKPTMGNFKVGFLANVTWHPNGSFVVMGHVSEDAERAGKKFCVSHIEAGALQAGWKQLWNIQDDSRPPLTELIYASIDQYAAGRDRFVFIKSQKQGEEVDFLLALDPPKIESRLTYPDNRVVFNPRPAPKTQWAHCVRDGRPTPGDTWELKLKVGQNIKILEDLGNDWFRAENIHGLQGYAHRSTLDFRGAARLKPPEAYAKFQDDVGRMFSVGSIRVFPDLSEYVDTCRSDACKIEKLDPVGLHICVHDLETLLRGSGCYSRALLKEERNRWHPDKFARFCEESLRGELLKKAEHLFVLFGMMIDWLEQSD